MNIEPNTAEHQNIIFEVCKAHGIKSLQLSTLHIELMNNCIQAYIDKKENSVIEGKAYTPNELAEKFIIDVYGKGSYGMVVEESEKAFKQGLSLRQNGQYIICAANYYQDGVKHEHQPANIEFGFVTTGRRHHNCIGIFAAIVGFPYNEEGHKIHRTEVQGFLTNDNLFVNRKEALVIAENARQIIHDVKLDNHVGLSSEDIY